MSNYKQFECSVEANVTCQMVHSIIHCHDMVQREEHLALMGVASYPYLSADMVWPPFDFESMPEGAIKKLSGNVPWLHFNLSTNDQMVWIPPVSQSAEGMHAAVIGAVWACLLSTWAPTDAWLTPPDVASTDATGTEDENVAAPTPVVTPCVPSYSSWSGLDSIDV